MNKLITYIFVVATFLTSSLEAQGIKRSTLCSIGSSNTVGNFRIASSFGQKSVTCSVIYGDGLILRQGFQQPSFQSPCEFSVGAAWEEVETECGFYYYFEYQGDVNIDNADFLWNFGENGFPETSNQLNPIDIAFATSDIQTIRLTVTENDCTSFFVFQLDSEKADFGVQSNVIHPECSEAPEGKITFDLLGEEQPVTYAWDDGSTEGIRNDLSPGDYAYTITNGNGCRVTGMTTIDNPPNGLMLDAVTTDDDCATENRLEGEIDITVTNATSAIEYNWSNGSTDEDIYDLEAGEYTVTILDSGCSLEMTYVVNDCNVSIPDLLTPNGDDQNDIWVVPGIENYPDNVTKIYNRWGSIIYEVDGYMNEWQGTNMKGEPLVTGAYYYVIRLNDAENTVWGGAVTVIW